jgi:regulator of protease activity HflC (stomatin/prohibitin superfamily)
MMRNLFYVIVLLTNTGCIGCERIDAGNVGIEIQLAGRGQGVQDVPLVSGWQFYNKFTTEILEYPTYMQTAVWKEVEAVSFNSMEGLTIGGDISLSYQLDALKVPAFYVKFRSDDLEKFTHGFLRNVARDMFNEVAGTFPVEDLYGPKKEAFLQEVRKRTNASLASIGVHVEQLGFVGAPKLPESVVQRINLKIAATQQAIQVENELRTATAEAAKKVAQAKGEADSAVMAAQGSATARIARAKGEAEANAILTKSLSTELLKWRETELVSQAIGRWNGAYPAFGAGQNGQNLLLQLPTVASNAH